MHVGQVVGAEFQLQDLPVDGVRFGEVEAALDSRVKNNLVEIWVLLSEILDKLGYLFQIGDIERLGGDLVILAVLRLTSPVVGLKN